MQGKNLLIICALCISAPMMVIPLFKLIDWLHIGKENADHTDFECSGPCHTHSSLQINKLAFRFYNPFCKHLL